MTTQMLSDFAFSNFRKAHRFVTFIERPKPKSVSFLGGGLRSPDFLTRGFAPGPHWDRVPRFPL